MSGNATLIAVMRAVSDLAIRKFKDIASRIQVASTLKWINPDYKLTLRLLAHFLEPLNRSYKTICRNLPPSSPQLKGSHKPGLGDALGEKIIPVLVYGTYSTNESRTLRLLMAGHCCQWFCVEALLICVFAPPSSSRAPSVIDSPGPPTHTPYSH